MPISGGCVCGNVRYESTEDNAGGGICHCDDCRKTSGTGHAAHAFLPADTITFSGEMKAYEHKSDSGNTLTRSFCPDCGSSIVSQSTGMPGMAVVRVSSFDDPNRYSPMMVVYNKRAASWDKQQADIPHFDEMPPADG